MLNKNGETTNNTSTAVHTSHELMSQEQNLLTVHSLACTQPQGEGGAH